MDINGCIATDGD